MSGLVRLRAEGVDDRGPGAQRRILREADGERDAVRREEADAPDVTAEAIGVALDDGNGVGTVFPIDLRGLAGRNPIGLREDHHLARALPLAPALNDGFDLLGTDLGDFAQTSRMMVEDVDRISPEFVNDAVREHGSDAVDESAREIAADTLSRLRRNTLNRLRLELATTDGIVHPLARRVEVFPLPRGGTGAEHSDLALGQTEAPVVDGGDMENGETRLVVAEHDGLDGAIDRLDLHALRHRQVTSPLRRRGPS